MTEIDYQINYVNQCTALCFRRYMVNNGILFILGCILVAVSALCVQQWINNQIIPSNMSIVIFAICGALSFTLRSKVQQYLQLYSYMINLRSKLALFSQMESIYDGKTDLSEVRDLLISECNDIIKKR
jgi:hypothetical protein